MRPTINGKKRRKMRSRLRSRLQPLLHRMPHSLLYRGALGAVVLVSLVLSSCDVNLIGKKEVNEDTLREYYTSGVTVVQLEAAQRLLSAIAGNTVPGVSLVPNGTRIDASVGMDFDYDGTRETSVEGNVQFANSNMSFDDGASVNITGVTGAGVDGNVSATATTSGPGTVALVGTGQFEGDSGTPVDLGINLSVSPVTGQILGTVDIDAGDLSAMAIYEDNGVGGFRVRVVGDDFEFVVGY